MLLLATDHSGRVLALYAAMHAHAVHYDPVANGMHDDSTTRRDATGAVDAPGTDHGVCVSTVDSHGRHERGDAESGEYEKAHSCLLGLGLCLQIHQLDAG